MSQSHSELQSQNLKAFQFRHACKLMDANQKKPQDVFQTVLDTARLSPSSFGFEWLSLGGAMGGWTSKQTYIALANTMTSAAMMEIDSCPIEGFKQKETNDFLAAEFGVDTSESQAAYRVPFGHRVNPPNPKTGQAAEVIFEWF